MTRRRSVRTTTPRSGAGVGAYTVPATAPETPSTCANMASAPPRVPASPENGYITPSHGHGGLIRPWQPGESGNPNGRPRLVEGVRARFAEIIKRRGSTIWSACAPEAASRADRRAGLPGGLGCCTYFAHVLRSVRCNGVR